MTDSNVVDLPKNNEKDRKLVDDLKDAAFQYITHFLQEGARGFSIIAHYPDAPALPGVLNLNPKHADGDVMLALEALKMDLIQNSRMGGMGNE